MNQPLRVAVPNKGALSDDAGRMLTEAGYISRSDSRTLTLSDSRNGVEFFFLRPRDIAIYVGSGELDLGITGRDLLLDSENKAKELQPLGFGISTFRFAGPNKFSVDSDLNGLRVATSYPRLTKRFMAENSISATIVHLDGAVESAVSLGLADAIADVVSTGSTLRSQGLAAFGSIILESEAVLIGSGSETIAVKTLMKRLQGVWIARQYVLMDYDLPVSLIERASEVTPGLESPTVAPLRDPGWVAVRAMVPKGEANQVMDRLYKLGARAVLASAIHSARI